MYVCNRWIYCRAFVAFEIAVGENFHGYSLTKRNGKRVKVEEFLRFKEFSEGILTLDTMVDMRERERDEEKKM